MPCAAGEGAGDEAGCRAELHVAACDYQWAGPGLGAVDVMYLLWTSVEPDVVREHEESLLRHVCNR